MCCWQKKCDVIVGWPPCKTRILNWIRPDGWNFHQILEQGFSTEILFERWRKKPLFKTEINILINLMICFATYFDLKPFFWTCLYWDQDKGILNTIDTTFLNPIFKKIFRNVRFESQGLEVLWGVLQQWRNLCAAIRMQLLAQCSNSQNFPAIWCCSKTQNST